MRRESGDGDGDDYEAGEADWEVPISQPGQYPVTASPSSSVGRTLPRQLDPEFYARILRSSEPEADFQVPIRAKWLHFSQLEPGHIFMINRPSWTVARSRASQKRLRGGEDQPCNGGWNRRGLPKEVQITGDLSMSHKLLVEAFAAQNPPTSYHAELPRKLEIWLVPQDYVVATETEERDPVPSYVLVHYLKEDAPTHSEVLPPIIIQDDLPPAAQNLDEDQTEEVQGSLFAGFHLPTGSFASSSISSSSSSSALMKRNLDEAGLDDPEAPPRAGKGGRGGLKPVPPRANKTNANSAASAMLALTRQ